MGTSSAGGVERLLREFFAAENSRDWRAYARFLHPDVEWTLVDGSAERRIVGRAEYLSVIAAAYDDVTTTFRCLDMTVDQTRTRVASLLVDEAGERSVDVFDFDGDLIRREWEFLLGPE
jgi:hypothetical protein